MKKLLICLAIALGVLAAAYYYRRPIQTFLFEKALNTSTSEFFKGSLRLKSAVIDRGARIHINQIKGTLQSEGGPVNLELDTLNTEKVFPDMFTQTVPVYFSGLRPAGSKSAGIRGRSEVKAGKNWVYQANIDIAGMDLREVQWLNPENLNGSTGTVQGTIKIHADAGNPEVKFQAVFLAGTGGTLQARFFEVLLPYLPALPTKVRMEELAASGKLVKFKDAALRIESAASSKLKVAFHILIPDYNVELNINLEIRIDDDASFMELSKLLGFVKVKS